MIQSWGIRPTELGEINFCRNVGKNGAKPTDVFSALYIETDASKRDLNIQSSEKGEVEVLQTSYNGLNGDKKTIVLSLLFTNQHLL